MSGTSEYLGNSNDEEECAILVKEKKPLATGASYRTSDRFCWAGFGNNITECSVCRACLFQGIRKITLLH